MRYMRLFASLTMLLLLGLLAGCGGGGGGGSRTATRKITIQFRWPTTDKAAASQKAGRANVKTVNSVLIEVYDGTKRIGVVKFAAGTQTNTLDVPAKDLTFYANAFNEAAAPDYITDPANGQLLKAVGTPLAFSDAHPVASAVTTVNVPALPPPPVVAFTLNNTIVNFVPVRTTFSLDTPAVSLNTTVRAVTADGATVLVSPTSLAWKLDSTNALENLRATLSPLADQTAFPGETNAAGASPVLNLKATGVVHLTVIDRDVNTPAVDGEFNQQPITANLTYTITPHATQPVLTLNAGANTPFLNSLPLYTKSVTLTLTQAPLVDPNATPAPAVLDSPPPPVSVTSATTFNATNRTISVNAALNPALISSGRVVTLLAQAFSNADGTGALLAKGTLTLPIANQPGANGNVDLALNQFYVTSFTLTPANPTISLADSATIPTPPPPGINFTRLQVSANLAGSGQTGLPLDPRTLNITSSDTTVATITNGPADSNGNITIQVNGVANAGNASATTRTATITASDTQRPSVTGNTVVSVKRVNAGFGFN